MMVLYLIPSEYMLKNIIYVDNMKNIAIHLLFLVIIPGTIGTLIHTTFNLHTTDGAFWAILIPWLILNQQLLNKFTREN